METERKLMAGDENMGAVRTMTRKQTRVVGVKAG
jgi:hypothetical protein